jgi:hypothetical protein
LFRGTREEQFLAVYPSTALGGSIKPDHFRGFFRN